MTRSRSEAALVHVVDAVEAQDALSRAMGKALECAAGAGAEGGPA